ncbi:MAG: ribosome silencing factor [Desulfobacterales bacterium]|nr:ribosome silencing factor [Desulfobacterales bacterium]
MEDYLNEIKSNIDVYIKAVSGKKAKDILIIDLRGLSYIADFFVICTGMSSRQVSSVGEFILYELKKADIKPLGFEGIAEGHWVLLDYTDVVIHVFYEPIRTFYNLEGLWPDARKIRITSDSDGLIVYEVDNKHNENIYKKFKTEIIL